jgi:hypothetical protein
VRTGALSVQVKDAGKVERLVQGCGQREGMESQRSARLGDGGENYSDDNTMMKTIHARTAHAPGSALTPPSAELWQ